jgi:hypothetical protein
MMQVVFAGAAAVAMLALFDAAPPDIIRPLVSSGSVGLIDQAFPPSAPSLVGSGFAADDNDDQQAQQQEQLAQEEMQQSEQQAEEQNQIAQQQAQQAEQQANQ